MYRRFHASIVPVFLIGCVIAVSGLVTACGGGEGEQQSDRSARIEELRAQKQALDDAREELAEMEARLELAEAGEPVDTAEGEEAAADEVDVEALRTEIQTKNADITEMADQFQTDLVAFINEDPPIQGEPISEPVQQAFALKAREDMVLAQEYITEGGNYGRAITMYEDILRLPLDEQLEQEVQSALERAQDLRYMDEERFSQVERGMTQDQVRDILGTVNPRNRRDFPERKVLAWFYQKNEEGEAAAVWFQQKGEDWVVYRTDFDVKTKEEAEEG